MCVLYGFNVACRAFCTQCMSDMHASVFVILLTEFLQLAVVVEAILNDPVLSAKGGLRRLSELGRLLPESAFMEGNSDDDDLLGDSDDNDYAQPAIMDDSDNDEAVVANLGPEHNAHWDAQMAHLSTNQLLDMLIGNNDDEDVGYPVMHE